MIKYFTCLALLVFLTSYTSTKDIDREEVLIELVVNGLANNHFQSLVLNDELSVKIFDLYIDRLDRSKRFLLSSDIEKLTRYRTRIDDELNEGKTEFFELSIGLIEKRIKDAENFYKDILEKPFDFTREENIEMEADNLDFVATKKELKDRWRKVLKYQVMNRINNKLDAQETAIENSDTSVTIKTFAVLEEEARTKVEKTFRDWFYRMSKINREDRLATFINSLTNVYGPHTTYFPPKAKDNYDIAMSGQLEGIGAQLQQKDEYIKVTSIVPGSACWRQGDLEAGDLILKVAQGDQEPVDIVDMRIDDAVQLIRGKKGTEVRLTVKKIDGTQMVIQIIRDVVLLEETYAKSAILKNIETGKNFGYIDLPKFYADFNRRGGRSCATDVKNEIEKLKQDGIDGIILDLRSNGGGSLQDAVRMSGLFIEKGPIVQVKGRTSKPYVLRDVDQTVQYGGPLVILVNSFSASASEILAAAIQDYQRGVIIGSKSTFGKGTVQRFYDLDDFLNSQYEEIKPLGAIKLTTQKFYRINGGATQRKGVIPDIILADNYSYINVGVQELDHVMPWDEIDPAKYTPWSSFFLELDKLKDKSKIRTQSNNFFTKVDENAKWLKAQRDKTVFTLEFDSYREEQQAIDAIAKKFKGDEKELASMEVFSLTADMESLKSDSAKFERRAAWHTNLNKDMYLFEAMSVLGDMAGE
ncbi:MAG: carboxy terminal-processing peptidase [Bacteroidetes bacterium]|nr:carboxy terminal-processing peptidase [Bacteroidota bacterium]